MSFASPRLSVTALIPLALRQTVLALFRPFHLLRYLGWALLLWLAWLNIFEFIVPVGHFLNATAKDANPETISAFNAAHQESARHILEFIFSNLQPLVTFSFITFFGLLFATLYISSHALFALLHRQILALSPLLPISSRPLFTPPSGKPPLGRLAYRLFLFRTVFSLATVGLLGLLAGVTLILAYPDINGTFPGPTATLLLRLCAALEFLLVLIAAVIAWIVHLLVVPLMYSRGVAFRPAWRVFETELGGLFDGDVWRLLGVQTVLAFLVGMPLLGFGYLLYSFDAPPLSIALLVYLVLLPIATFFRYHALLFLEQTPSLVKVAQPKE